MAGPGGAGRGGGLLFIAVLAFVAYLSLTALQGTARILAVVALAAVMLRLTANVLRRR